MKHTTETKEKISKKMSLEKHPRARKIVDKDGNTWGCLKLLANELNIDKNNLSNMMNGKKKFSKNIEGLGLRYLP